MMTMSKPPTKATQPLASGAKSVLEQSLHALGQSLPEGSTQQHAFQAFAVTGMPTRRHEAWKYIQLDRLLRQSVALPTTNADVTTLPNWTQDLLYPESVQARVVLMNGMYQPTLSTLPKGVTCNMAPLNPEPIVVLANTNPLVWLNQAFAQDALVIEVAANTELTQPIQILSITLPSSDAAPAMLMTQPQVRISLGAYAKATVMLTHAGDPEPKTELPYWSNALTQVVCAEGAELNVSLFQAESPTAFYTGATTLELAAYSRCQFNTVGLSGQLGRHQLHVVHKGAESHSTLYGLSVLDGVMQLHHHTVIEHTVSHAGSQQIYKSILDDESRCEFDGAVWIHPNAQQVDAAQLNKNLLLSKKARVYTRPQLKIDADDVKCAHGATVGQLNEKEVFYLQSRGIDVASARTLLTQAFAQDLIDKLPVRSCHDHVTRVLAERLQKTL